MAGKKISHVQGKGSIAHNNRTFQPKNADKERKKDNITLVKEPIGKAYERIFGEAVAEYNEKQKRADRRIDDYYEHLFHRKPCNEVITGANKQKSFYEDLVQIGDMNDTPCGSEDAEIAKECLVEYLNGWKQRNPNFELFNAVIHMDEATPHLHLDYIPVCHSKRGLALQNGLAKALGEMGFGTGPDAINKWRERERKVFADICRHHGIDVAAEEPGRGHSYTVDEYKELQETKKALQEDINILEGKREAIVEQVREDASLAVRDLNNQVADELFRSPSTYAAGIAYLTSCDDEEFERITSAGQKLLTGQATENNVQSIDELIKTAIKAGKGTLSKEERSALWNEYRTRRAEVDVWARAASMNLALANNAAWKDLKLARQRLNDMNSLLKGAHGFFTSLFAFIMILAEMRKIEECQARINLVKEQQQEYRKTYNSIKQSQRIAAQDLINCTESAQKALNSMKQFMLYADQLVEQKDIQKQNTREEIR